MTRLLIYSWILRDVDIIPLLLTATKTSTSSPIARIIYFTEAVTIISFVNNVVLMTLSGKQIGMIPKGCLCYVKKERLVFFIRKIQNFSPIEVKRLVTYTVNIFPIPL